MIARIVAGLIAVAPIQVLAQAQVVTGPSTGVVVRGLRLPSLAEPTSAGYPTVGLAGTRAKREFFALQPSADSPRVVRVPLQSEVTSTPRLITERTCSMPVATDFSRQQNAPVAQSVIDSTASNPPGRAALMPTRTYDCINTLQR